MSEFVVESAAEGERLDAYLARQPLGISRAKVQKLIAAGAVLRNEAPARGKDLVVTGDRIQLSLAVDLPSSPVPAVAMELAILYEDEHLIVLNKPAGVAVHPGAGDTGATLVQGILHHCGTLSRPLGADGLPDPSASIRPGIVHRLDKDTTGVLVCAKTDRAHAGLAKQFQSKATLQRNYTALLDGVFAQPEVLYSSYLYRDPQHRLRYASMTTSEWAAQQERGGRLPRARLAKSLFTRQALYGQRLTLANIRLFTGRTHQIRVHARALGMGVVGDQLYHHVTQLPLIFPSEVRAAVAGVRRQLLHAASLHFLHPITGVQCAFTAPLPSDFSDLLNSLAPFRWDL